jgi:glycosyltransferase involved in cell wall biosynthesis
MKSLRILHVIDHIYPMLGYQETFLAKAHSRTNETLVITSDQYTRSLYDANENILKKRIVGTGFSTEEGIEILRLPVRFNIEALNAPWLAGLENAVTGFEPDAIIAHGIVNITSIRIAMLKPRVSKARLIFDDHMTFNATRGGWVNLLYQTFRTMFTPLFLKTADAFVAVTYETKRFMHEVYGIPIERIIVIPLGIDLDNFCHDSQARKLTRQKYRIKDDDVVFIYAGKIIREKGVHLFIDAALQACKNHEKVRFMIVGGQDPIYLAGLKSRISSAHMSDHFSFIDAVPNKELYKYYSAADVGVWPLQCSMTMLEATACGLPIIISDKSGATERTAFGNGLLYKEFDSSDLAAKITLMLDDKLREKMSEKAVSYSKTLCWDSLAERFLDILKF